MTQPATRDLAAILANTRCLLLDFDGPVCAVFGGAKSAAAVTRDLYTLATEAGAPLPDELKVGTDPFAVLRAVAATDPGLLPYVEAAFTAAELEAVRTARPTPHTEEAIRRARAGGRKVGIVSNNSTAAVCAYLTAHGVLVDVVVGRSEPDPLLLKPNPHLIERALRKARSQPELSTIVGDSSTDIEAARAAGVASVGYANKPGKAAALDRAGANTIIDSMRPLAKVFPC